MNRTLIALLLLLIAVTACAPAAQQPAPAPAPAPTAAPSAPAPLPTIDYSMSQATQDKVTAGLKSTTKYSLSHTFARLAPGQHETFGIGFTNRFREKDNFLVSIEFKKAYDKATNNIDSATADNVATWLAQNDFSITPLQPDQQSIQPIVIEVANFADGSAPPKGTYEFTAEVLHQGTFFGPTEEYSGELQIAILVT